jgi:hypothetical protein
MPWIRAKHVGQRREIYACFGWSLATEPTPSHDKLMLPDGVVVPMTSPEALNAVTPAFAAMGQAAADLPPPVAEVDPESQPAVDHVVDVAHVDHTLKNTARQATLFPDGLNAIMVRALGRAAREWLAARFSTILNNPDAMPSRWRFSYIVLVPKPGTPVNDGAISLGHLRPVALTSILCRTFKKCILRMMKPNIRALHLRQFGFRRDRTPLVAVIHAVEDAVDASRRVTRHNRHKGVLALCDFGNAFASVAPSLMIDRLRRLGVPSVICQWIAAWLRNTPRASECAAGTLHRAAMRLPAGIDPRPILWSAFVDPLLADLDRRCVSRSALGGRSQLHSATRRAGRPDGTTQFAAVANDLATLAAVAIHA